jgi:hypothetical protein
MALTAKQMLIAADMCEARKVHLDAGTDDDSMAAAEWIFDYGIFHGGEKLCDMAAQALRDKARASIGGGNG